MKENKIKRLLKEFKNIDEYERHEILCMLKATSLANVLYEIQNDVFRPARKHGYPDKEIEQLIDMCGEDKEGNNIGCLLIEKLEELYLQKLRDKELIDFL